MKARTATPRRFRSELFLLDWLPLLTLIAAYEGLRDLVPLINAPHHDLGWVDSALFGGRIPSSWLQAHFYRPQSIDWEDSLATAAYFAYYLIPAFVGLVWWFKSRTEYHRFAAALLTLCALAFVTYVVLPTVPPWLAHPQSVEEITDATILRWNLPRQLVAMYLGHDYNLYAAFPSLHAAFPVVLSYYGWLRSRLLGLLMSGYAGLVWVSVVFLGEHYVVDIAGGIAYAVVAIVVVEFITSRRNLRRRSVPTL